MYFIFGSGCVDEVVFPFGCFQWNLTPRAAVSSVVLEVFLGFCSEFKRCRCCCLGPYASGLFCIQLVLSMPLMCWLPGCVFKAIGWNRDASGSSCFWSQLGYPAACNWDKTLAASPREILRSINKLQTQLNRGGLAGFEFSRLCKSISSCFVLIPRKASISMSSPVWASIVR